MPSREPMWFCHECHAEMRPLMIPDPHCASCNGTFVEKIESEQDDPRAFQEAGPAWEDGAGPDMTSPEWFANLMNLIANPEPGSRTSLATSLPSQRSPPPTGPRLNFQFHTSRGTRLGGSDGRTQTFVGHGGGPIAGTLMAHYLLSLLNQRAGQGGGHEDPFSGLVDINPEDGRWGDYAFTQEALDRIMTQLMENAGQSSRPAGLSEEDIGKLDRLVLEEGSPLLDKDCAVCKEQFSLSTEDPNDQVVVTLPCKHPFHEGCIVPWVKTTASCPVCRHSLGPEANNENRPSSSRPSSPNTRITPRPSAQTGSSSGSNSTGGGSSLFGPLFSILSGGNARSGSSGSSSASRNTQQRHDSDVHDDVPGGWVD